MGSCEIQVATAEVGPGMAEVLSTIHHHEPDAIRCLQFPDDTLDR